MPILEALKLTTAKKARHVPPILVRRRKIANKPWEQIQLARSHAQSAPFTVTKCKSMVDKTTGFCKQVELPKRLRAWWFTNEGGKLCVNVRYGTQVIELAKGKYSIEVADEQALITALEKVK